jgi:hypothetical protein
VSDITGGLRWHLRAVMGRLYLWRPFMDDLRDWLATWQPHSEKLLIVGASAGWSLPDEFLARFSRIDCIDKDELAAPLFKLVHWSLRDRVQFAKRDFFAEASACLADYSDHAVLLCNLAGQRCFQLRDPKATATDLNVLRERLQFREWASFHDLLSSAQVTDLRALDLAGRASAKDIIEAFGLSGEWYDHVTGDLLPENWQRSIIPWQFASGRLHLIEAGFSPICRPS